MLLLPIRFGRKSINLAINFEGPITLEKLSPELSKAFSQAEGTQFSMRIRETKITDQNYDLTSELGKRSAASSLFVYLLESPTPINPMKNSTPTSLPAPKPSLKEYPVSLKVNNEKKDFSIRSGTSVRDFLKQISKLAKIPEDEIHLLKEGQTVIPHDIWDTQYQELLDQTFYTSYGISESRPSWLRLSEFYSPHFTLQRRRRWFYRPDPQMMDEEWNNLLEQYTFQPQLQNPEWMLVYSIHRCSPFSRENPLTENFYRTMSMYATTDRYTAMETTIIRALYGDCPEHTTCKVFLMRKSDFHQLKIEKCNENRWNQQLLYSSDTPIQHTILYTLTIDPQGKIDLSTPFSNHPQIKAMQRSFHFRELRELILFSYKDAEAHIFKHLNPSQKRTKRIGQQQEEKNYKAFNDVFLAAASDFYPLEETDKFMEEDFEGIITLLSALTLLLAIVCKDPSRLARPAILRGVDSGTQLTFLHPHDPVMALFETTSVGTLFERGGFLRYWISFLNELDPRFLPSENESPYEVRRQNMDVLIEEIKRAYAYLDEANRLKFAQILVEDLTLMKLPTDNFLNNLVENPVIPQPEEVLSEPLPEVELELLKPLILIDPDLLFEGPVRLNTGQPFSPSDLVTQTICVDDSHKYFQFLPEGLKIFNLLSRIRNQFDFILLGGNLSERSVQLNEVRKNYMCVKNEALAPFPPFKLAFTTLGEEIASHSQSNRIIHSPDAQPLIENFYVIDPSQGEASSAEFAEAQRNNLPAQIFNILVHRFAVSPQNLIFMISRNKLRWNDYLLSQNVKHWASLNGEGEKILKALMEITFSLKTHNILPPRIEGRLYGISEFIESTHSFSQFFKSNPSLDNVIREKWKNLVSSPMRSLKKRREFFLEAWSIGDLAMVYNFFNRMLGLAQSQDGILLDNFMREVLLDLLPYFQNWILLQVYFKEPFMIELIQDTLLSSTPTLLTRQLLEILRQTDNYLHFDSTLHTIINMRQNDNNLYFDPTQSLPPNNYTLCVYFISQMLSHIEKEFKPNTAVKPYVLFNASFFKPSSEMTPRFRVGHILNEVKKRIETITYTHWSSHNAKAEEALQANSALELFPHVAGLTALGFFDKNLQLATFLMENLRGNVPLLSCFQKFSATNLKTTHIPQTFDDDTLDSIVTALHNNSPSSSP